MKITSHKHTHRHQIVPSIILKCFRLKLSIKFVLTAIPVIYSFFYELAKWMIRVELSRMGTVYCFHCCFLPFGMNWFENLFNRLPALQKIAFHFLPYMLSLRAATHDAVSNHHLFISCWRQKKLAFISTTL